MENFPSIITTTGTPGSSGPRLFYVPASTTNGQWVTIQVADDGDQRDVATMFSGLEATKLNLDFVAARTIDWIYGGDYRTLFRGTQVSIANLMRFDRSLEGSAAVTAYFAGDTVGELTIDAYATGHSGGGTAGTCARFTGHGPGTAVKAIGGATGAGLEAWPGGGTAAAVVAHGPSTYPDGNSWRVNRSTNVIAADPAFPAQAWDTVWCYNAGGSAYDIKLTNPNTANAGGAPLPEGIRVTFVAPGMPSGTSLQTLNVSAVSIKNSAGTLVATLGPTTGQFKMVTFETKSVSSTIVWDLIDHIYFTA